MQCPTGGYLLGGVMISIGARIGMMAAQSDNGEYNEQEAQQGSSLLVAGGNVVPACTPMRGCRRRIDEVVEHRKRALNTASLQRPHDEDETRAPVGVRPLFEMARRMDDVLNAVDQHRSRHPGDV